MHACMHGHIRCLQHGPHAYMHAYMYACMHGHIRCLQHGPHACMHACMHAWTYKMSPAWSTSEENVVCNVCAWAVDINWDCRLTITTINVSPLNEAAEHEAPQNLKIGWVCFDAL